MKYINTYTEAFAKWSDKEAEYVEEKCPLFEIKWESEDEDYSIRSKYLDVLFSIQEQCPEKVSSYLMENGDEYLCHLFIIELGQGKALFKKLEIKEK